MALHKSFALAKGRPWTVCLLLVALVGGAIPCWRTSVAHGELPTNEEPVAGAAELVTEVRIVGNDTISTSQVAAHLATRVGRPFERSIVQRDVRRLANLGWFIDVKPLYERTPQGRIVIFEVAERPTIRYVTYLGNEEVTDKNLAKQTGLKSGGAVDPYAVEEGRRKLTEYYKSRGFSNVQITILEGSKPTDQGITYLINEGKAMRVWDVDFVGNEFVSDGRLKTLIKCKPPKFMVLKGYLDREQIDKDLDQLTAYYRSFGFFQARVSRKVDYFEGENWAKITYVIHEGMRYQIRSVRYLGNTIFEPKALAEAATLKQGVPFEQDRVREDAAWLQELYGSHGYVFADVRPETVYLEEPGEVDLLFHIEEGEQFRIGEIIVNIGGDNPHTRIQTALNRMSLRPGEILDIRELKASERRLVASSLFHTDPASGVRPKLTYRISDDSGYGMAAGPGENDFGQAKPSKSRNDSAVRAQSPEPAGPYVLPPPGSPGELISPAGDRKLDMPEKFNDEAHYQQWLKEEPQQETQEDSSQKVTTEKPVLRGQSPQPRSNGANWIRPVHNSAKDQQIARRPTNPYGNIRGQSPGTVNSAYSDLPAKQSNSPYGGRLVGATGPSVKPPATSAGQVQQAQYSEYIPPPAGSIGPTPGFSANPVPGYQLFPDGHYGLPGLPYPDRTVDIIFQGQETQTGRLMLGVGVNSDAGVVGNVVVDERNFDWRRPPRSWEDIRNGLAFRGAGQRFRIDASPGSQVNRYLMSFSEPYLLDTPISLGLSGSYYDRRYRDWDEQRLGGRISLGYQWVEHDLSANLSYRGENVNIRDATPGVPELQQVVGDNVLHGFKLTVVNDTRDSSFLPTQGHYMELAGEHVVGTFEYPRVTADFREYFLLRERPDHSGRHVLSFASNIGWSGEDTPVYEHFFAGGFSTLRGFDFRGASPVDLATGAEVGGEFQWLNSIQYLFPITADDMLHGVVFCDYGTVERDVEINNFRVAPGVGLRVTVPAMGPAPIALDFSWAVDKADFDDTEVFSFSLGFTR